MRGSTPKGNTSLGSPQVLPPSTDRVWYIGVGSPSCVRSTASSEPSASTIGAVSVNPSTG